MFKNNSKTPPGPNWKPVSVSYQSTNNVFEWVEIAPKQEIISSDLLPFIKKIKKYEQVSHDFQEDINQQICITPDMISKLNIVAKPTTKADFNDLTENNGKNINDLTEKAKQLTHNQINKTSESLADLKIKQIQEEINKIKAKQAINNQQGKEANNYAN